MPPDRNGEAEYTLKVLKWAAAPRRIPRWNSMTTPIAVRARPADGADIGPSVRQISRGMLTVIAAGITGLLQATV